MDSTGELFIVQARPETVQSRKNRVSWKPIDSRQHGRVLVPGEALARKSRRGRCESSRTRDHLREFQKGEVLVTDKTDPDWEPIMKKAAAIVTNRGGRTCHAAIVSRELGLAAVVGTEHGTELLEDGQVVTVSCAEGDMGFVYETKLPFEIERTNSRNFVVHARK